MVLSWLFYVYKQRILLITSIQIKKYKELKSSEKKCARKKDFFYDSQKLISTKKIFAVQVYFFIILIIIIIFCGLVFTDSTDFEFSLSKLAHTNILVGKI